MKKWGKYGINKGLGKGGENGWKWGDGRLRKFIRWIKGEKGIWDGMREGGILGGWEMGGDVR